MTVKTLNKVSENLLDSLYGKWGCLLLSSLFISIYLYHFFTRWPILHCETLMTFSHLVSPDGEGFWRNLLSKTFDLSIVEQGNYRPRALGLLVGYLDSILLVELYQHMPQFGARHPFTLVALALTVFSVYLFVKTVFPKIPWQAALATGSCVLFFHNYQTATYLYQRSAKLLAPGACLLVLVLFLRNYRKLPAGGKLRKLLPATLGLFLLTTLDEQVLATVGFMALFSMMVCLWERRPTVASILFSATSLLYALYHLWWGRLLFQYFTPVKMGIHGHQISSVLGLFSSWEYMWQALQVFMHATVSFHANLFLFLTFALFFLLMCCETGAVMEKMISLALAGAGLVLVAFLILAHPMIYSLPDLWDSAYIAPACFYYFAAWTLALAQIKTVQKAIPAFLVLSMVLVACLNLRNVDLYYETPLSTRGGHMPVDRQGFAYRTLGNYNALFSRTVKTGSDFYGDRVERLMNQGILTGDTFSWHVPVRKEEIAALLVRAMEGEPHSGPGVSSSPFRDVPIDHPYFKYIQRAWELGIVTGCDRDLFCPRAWVPFSEMADYLLRARLGTPFPNYCRLESPEDGTLPEDSHCRFLVDYLKKIGTDPVYGFYQSSLPLQSEQLAVIISRAFVEQGVTSVPWPAGSLDLQRIDRKTTAGQVDFLNSSSVRLPDIVQLAGWAYNVADKSPARSVCMVQEQKSLLLTPSMDGDRPDVSKELRFFETSRFGWAITLRAGLLGVGRHRLTIYALQKDGKLYPILFRGFSSIDLQIDP